MIFLYFTQSFCQREAEGGNDIEKAISGEEHGYAIVQFTVLPVENGYRLKVSYGEEEYMWPNLYGTLEQAGKQVLQALTTASESRGEITKSTSA